MPQNLEGRSSRPSRDSKRHDSDARIRSSAKEAAIRNAASKATKRKDWGGVARKGATWLGRDDVSSEYDEPVRSAPTRSTEQWVRDDASPRQGKSSGASRTRRRTNISDAAIKEVTKLAGKNNAPRLLRYLEQAAAAYENERWGEAQKALKPLLDSVPDAPSVVELDGLIAYRTGKWNRAIEGLEFSRNAAGADQLLPAIMDCYRARKKYDEVDELWLELRESSPDAETMADGRIVAASSTAERGNVQAAIQILEKAPKVKGKARLHHLRSWYVLADLYEQAGDVARARRLFEQVAEHDADLADVLDRIDALA